MHPQHHDIDDLFRKAAARYPLQTGNGDWQTVEQKLTTPGKPASSAGKLPGGKNYVWLLLLPAAFLFHNSFKNNGIAYSNPGSTLATGPTKPPINKSALPVIVPQQKAALVQPVLSSEISENKTLSASLPHTISYHTGTGIPETIIAEKDFSIREQKKAANQHAKKVSARGLYLGGGTGLDFGTVKAQSFTNAGYNLGLLVGYRFNRRWSFESGFYRVQKKYFTRGEYFSMKKIESSMPGMEMVTVKGQLSLFEIPYKIKYDLLLKERSNLFIAAGGSSNIYTREDNEYYVRQNGVAQLHKASYNDIHCSPLCLIHFSTGYEHSLSSNTRLRLEPYIKIPLRKIGMGSVPVLSVGLNVSVSGFLQRQ